MRARIERDALKRALRTVMPAVGKTALPVLGGVRIDTIDGDGLRLTASDLQLTITADVDAKVLDPGAVVVPARLFSNFVDRCPDGGLVLEAADNLMVTAGDATADLHLLDLDGWPKVGPVEGDAITLSAEHVDLVRRILPFVSVDDQREILTGLHLEGATAATTDSYRLGVARLDGADLPACTVPSRAAAAALKDAEEVEVTITASQVTFAHDAATWTSVLLEGAYPPFERLLRDTSPYSMRFGAARLMEALSRTSLIDEGELAVRILPAGDKAVVSIARADIASIEDVIPMDGDYEAQIGFNGHFLTSLLTAAATDDVTLEVEDSLKPVVLRADRLDMLVMPVRIS